MACYGAVFRSSVAFCRFAAFWSVLLGSRYGQSTNSKARALPPLYAVVLLVTSLHSRHFTLTLHTAPGTPGPTAPHRCVPYTIPLAIPSHCLRYVSDRANRPQCTLTCAIFEYEARPTHHSQRTPLISLYFRCNSVILVLFWFFTIFSRYIAFGDILICGCIPILSQSVRFGIPTSPNLFPRHYEESLIKGI